MANGEDQKPTPLEQAEMKTEESIERQKAFDAFSNALHPILKTIYYPGPWTDISPSKTQSLRGSRIIYVDTDERAIKALQKAGYEAHVGDAKIFDPGQVDLLLMFNFYTEEPLRYVVEGGYVIINIHWAEKTLPEITDRKDFQFVGALTNASGEIKFDGENLANYLGKPNYNARKTENLFVFRKNATTANP